MPVFSVSNSFDASKPQLHRQPNHYDSIALDMHSCVNSHCESGAKYNARNTHLFDAENFTAANTTPIHFASEGRGLCKTIAVFDAVTLFEHPNAAVTGKFTLTQSWDTGALGRFQSIRPSYQMANAKYDAIIFVKYVTTSGLFYAKTKMFKRVSNFFDIMPGYQYVKTPGMFGAIATTKTALPIHKQAFVKPGWRILLRNVETDERRDLGFIEFDAAKKAIIDVEIPDGDYEITLFYSSLFWQNAADRIIRNVSIRSDEEPTFGLPPILNLRSKIENGVTRILWDSETGFDGVTFGLWFGSVRTLHPDSFQPPLGRFALLSSSTLANNVSGLMATERHLHSGVVPHDREPDQTVAYTASDVEYRVNFMQTLPMWCVVMAIKDNMRGPASEIFLEWETSLPRRPDDQIAFDVYLDEKLRQLKNATDQSGEENPAWDTSKGYW